MGRSDRLSPVGWAGWNSRHSLPKGPQALCVPAALNHLEVTPKVLFAASFTGLHVGSHGLLSFLSRGDGFFFFTPGSCSLVL